MPQHHAYLTNNCNDYEQFVQSGRCGGTPASRGIGKGTVCPAFPVPVGTGVLIAGGNRDLVTKNEIYDNWHNGVMLFWVPGAIRGDMSPAAQVDTSNDNYFTDNQMGFHPSGVVRPNGTDFWWDEQGTGNCWQGNTSSTTVTDNVPLALPDCASGGSLLPAGNAVKSASIVPCSQYNREDQPDPPGCDWFDTPAVPAGRQLAPGESPPASRPPPGGRPAPVRAAQPRTGDGGVLAATGGGVCLPRWRCCWA